MLKQNNFVYFIATFLYLLNVARCEVIYLEKEVNDWSRKQDYTPKANENFFQHFGNNFQKFVGRIRTRAKETFQHLHLGTPVEQMGVEMPGKPTNRPMLLQKIRERITKRLPTNGTTNSNAAAATPEAPLEYYGALSSRFQINFTNQAEEIITENVQEMQ